MRLLTTCTIQILVHCWISCAWADVESAVKMVERDISDKTVCRDEANKLVAQLPLTTLVAELLTMAEQPIEYGTHVAANKLILAIDPFPFQQLVERLPGETDSYRKSNLLWLLHMGSAKEDQGLEVLSFAKLQLDDDRPGVRPYGRTADEARAFVMLRVCDVAYNICVSRMKGEAKLKQINSRSDTVVARDRLLNRLRETLSMQPKEYAVAPPPSRVVVGNLDKPKAPIRTNEELPNESLSPKGFGLIWLPIILAAGVGLWLALRKLRQK